MTPERNILINSDLESSVPQIKASGKSDFAYGKDKANRYQPAKVDRVLTMATR